MKKLRAIILTSTALVILFAQVAEPKMAYATVGADEAVISATDSQGNEYEAWYLQDQSCSSGWSFVPEEILSTGGVISQTYCVAEPCDSYTYQQQLLIVRDNNNNRWEDQFTDQAGHTTIYYFSGGGPTATSWGEDLGSNIVVVSDIEDSSGHALNYYDAYPICSAKPSK
jgi:hypothetical protein